MCKALDDLKEEGRAEGKEEEREKNIHGLVRSCQKQGDSRKRIIQLIVDTFGLSKKKAMTYLPASVN